MKCKTCQKRSYRSPALHPLQDKCHIIRGEGKDRRKVVEVGKQPFCKKMAKLDVPINLTKSGSLRNCQLLQTKQIIGAIS